MDTVNSPEQELNKMGSRAFAFGITSIVAIFLSLYALSILFGVLAIVFGVLSKGSRMTLHPRVKTGVLLAAFGLAFSTATTASYTYLLFTNEEYRAPINELYEQTFGFTFDEYIESILQQVTGQKNASGNTTLSITDI